MKRTSISLLICASVFVFGCKNEGENNETDLETTTGTELTTEQDEMPASEEEKEITVDLEAKSGSNLSGTVTFTEENGEVRMQGTISGLSEGTHAIHLHEKADCSAEDGTSAGGHWNPTNEPHGEWGDSEGYHKGDIGNFQVDSNGEGNVSMSTDQWCIGCDDDNKNIVGKAVVVHDGVDDYTSQPSGDAGTRVGCGEIEM
ncbi:superoxide dismutase family protein [Salegentibacter sp. F188]|uniref:Superoxide dismutase [Cu-Zn] n=1 Tax=Autumnicola patrickiae TaxID=3075591 RepID=A0ABU3E6N4_9FLAO|nr:superoxide dismutase family protein [Salegentibacter sp. F188]MDT0691620.1 superoxide dismutase family protein [Salegentibacter sp. F188]